MFPFGIHIDTISRNELLKKIEESVSEKKSFRIATVNAEFLVRAKKDSAFKKSLQNADMRIRDGFGIGLAHWGRGLRAPERIPGIDLLKDILELAEKNHWTIYIANRKDGLSTFSEIQKAIFKKYPHITITGKDFDIQFLLDLPCRLSLVACRFVFCSFGAPEQEFFLEKLQKQKIPAIMMGVGGSFDFLTGKQTRAPLWMRQLGLEWFFRLLKQPSRARRILNAIFIFPILFLWDFYMHKK